MSMRLYNTLGRILEDFKPLHGNQVGLYTCGPTVYSTPHIGNFRAYIFADILRRTLLFNGYQVKQVINITDVGHLTSDGDEGEDKLEKGARVEGQTVWDVAAKYTKEFQDGLAQLNILPPDVWAKATDHIKEQISLIDKLVTNGHTYETQQALYFDVTSFKRYGQLSQQPLAEKMTGARSDVVTDTDKKHPADFALWFKRVGKFANHTMYWPSPWGDGFPGWHIECSAMSMKYLGEQFDLHVGGIDHIAVHHENEIAQSESASGKQPFVKYWMHNEFLTLPGKRMGKSEGNSITLADLGTNPLFFRYLCLLTHYRKPISFTTDSLTAAANALTRIWTLLEDGQLDRSVKPAAKYIDRFTDAINDDLNTPAALGVVHDLINDASISRPELIATLSVFDTVLALDLTPEASAKQLTVTGHDELLLKYELARKEKRFVDSDEIRQQFADMGIVVEDTPQGSRLRKA